MRAARKIRLKDSLMGSKAPVLGGKERSAGMAGK